MKTRRVVTAAVATAAVLLYLVVTLRHLGTVPPVHEDEPWQASVGARLATDGALASDLMAGYHGMERRYYGFMPLHPLLLAVSFRLLGPGLVAARLEAAGLGLAVLLLTGLVAWRLYDCRIAATAMALLVAMPWAPLPPYRLSGIPLLDQARIARYDIGVPVFGLVALLTLLSGSRRASGWWYVVAGGAAVLAGLTHLYGFFWLPVLLVLAIWNRAPRPHLAALVAGAAAALAPYALLVLTDLPTVLAQTRQYSGRFGLGTAGFYLASLGAERWRWGLTDLANLLRPGMLALVIGLPAATAALLVRGARHGDRAARAVAVPLVGLTALLAILVVRPERGYLLTVVPLAAIALAWGLQALWQRAGRRLWLRLALVTVTAAVLLDGVAAIVTLEEAARTTTPYRRIAAQLAAAVPKGATVLAPTRYTFGLEGRTVRSWWVPFALARPASGLAPVALTTTLERDPPEVLVVDDQVAASLDERPEWRKAVSDWAARHGCHPVTAVDDPTYGRIEVWRSPP